MAMAATNAGCVPIGRPSSATPRRHRIGRMMDRGVRGFRFPMSAPRAGPKAVVDAVKYCQVPYDSAQKSAICLVLAVVFSIAVSGFGSPYALSETTVQPFQAGTLMAEEAALNVPFRPESAIVGRLARGSNHDSLPTSGT